MREVLSDVPQLVLAVGPGASETKSAALRGGRTFSRVGPSLGRAWGSVVREFWIPFLVATQRRGTVILAGRRVR